MSPIVLIIRCLHLINASTHSWFSVYISPNPETKTTYGRKAAPPARVLPPGHLACWPAAGQTCCVDNQADLVYYLPATIGTACLLPVWLLPTNQQPAGRTNASLWHFWLFLPTLLGLLAVEAIEWVGSGWCTSNFLLSDSKSIPTDKIFSSWISTSKHPFL